MQTLLILSPSAFANDNDWAAGYSALKAGHYASAHKSLSRAAVSGDARAANLLGEMYATGKGVPANFARALEWFQNAAAKGEPKAQNNLGEMFANGWGVARDYAAAESWFLKAAEQNEATAHYNLGRLSAQGLLGPTEPAKAIARLQAAVQLDPQNRKFRNWLGSLYCDVDNYTDAEKEFRAIIKDAGRGDVWSLYFGISLLNVGKIDESRDAFEAALTQEPIQGRGIDSKKVARDYIERLDPYQTHYANAIALLAHRRLEDAAGEFRAAMNVLPTRDGRERLAAIERAVGARTPLSRLALAGVIAGAIMACAAWFWRNSEQTPKSAVQAEGGKSLIGGKYRLGEVIGNGGMGVVYAAHDTQLDRRVAMKKMRSELQQVPGERKRFLNEARLVARLSHPYIVMVHEVIERDGEVYLVLDFVDGKPLSMALAEQGSLPFAECARLLCFVCEAIDYAHRRRVLHRDLKPQNILLDSNGYPKVADFGLARLLKDSLASITEASIAGTPIYMAPEQYRGHVSPASDVYALGVTLYEMATGEPPFAGAETLGLKERAEYLPPSSKNPALPPGLDGLIARSLDPEPKRRIKSAATLAEDLKRLAAL